MAYIITNPIDIAIYIINITTLNSIPEPGTICDNACAIPTEKGFVVAAPNPAVAPINTVATAVNESYPILVISGINII